MNNTTVLITGASSGIGLASARIFASEGSNLVLFARRIDKLNEVKAELEKQYGIQVLVKQVDVRNKTQIEDVS